MRSVIHILDAHAANQIAAGEVVERPASVVKELVENSLDAGATRIDISIEGNGVPFIRVLDDGCGVSITDLPLAVIRHATSKISQIEDLDQLCTLGFRGEALPSIASVSNLEISSRPASEDVGLCLTLHGGEQEELKEVGCPVGTSVTVRNLFFNTPARLKFLKSNSTEFGLISDTIGRIALAHPEISFTLTHPHQVVLQTSGRGDLRETIGSIHGHTIARQLLALKAEQGNWLLEGFISPPDLVRSTKQAQTLMINGRIIRSPFLSRAVEEGYHTLVPVKLHPIIVLHLHVLPSDYDVNVHPTKMEVRFKNEDSLTPFIRKAVYQTLIASQPLPSFQTKLSSPANAKPAPTLQAIFSPAINLPKKPSPPVLQFQETSASPNAHSNHLEVQEPIMADLPQFFAPASSMSTHEEGLVTPFKPEKTTGNPDSASLEQTDTQLNLLIRGEAIPPSEGSTQFTLPAQIEPQTQNIFAYMWPLAQLFNTYILATDGSVLLMIDQHAAHERINYERLLAEFKGAEQASQTLLLPLTMEFTIQEEQVLLENLWVLNEMGFILELFGSRTYLLRGVPVQTGTFPADRLLRQFIEEVLQKNSTPSFEKLLEEWIYLLACKESIKAQDSLSLLEMEQLLVRLGKTDNPYTCPHGRPTMIKMTHSEIEKRFYRT